MPRRKKRNRSKFWLVPLLLGLVGVAALFSAWQVTREFESRGWDVPARIYAASVDLYPGRRLAPARLTALLAGAGFAADRLLSRDGTYSVGEARIGVRTREYLGPQGTVAPARLDIRFRDDTIVAITDRAGDPVTFFELEPALIGSVFPAHGEDRIVIAPDAVPALLTAGLKAVEDRRFDAHFGIDLRGILRAAVVNLRAGEVQQGASTLTQQLVRSFYLSTERTWWRKIREVAMSVALELQLSKEEILQAYVNEIYLGQDGNRAIHGFGLASQFYFAKPLSALELHEVSLLIAVIRGPSWYDPRRNPGRALERRNRVLEQMAAAGIILRRDAERAAGEALAVVSDTGATGYYAGALDLVRRQLRSDYDAEDLETHGLHVFTSIDPDIQGRAARAVARGVEALQGERPPLEAAAIVTAVQTAEVQAVVGGAQPGFNRALDARRQIGSLIKPFVYLAAINSGIYALTSMTSDEPISVPIAGGRTWAPQNFEGDGQGPVTLVRALVESLNLATVRIGMDVGVEQVALMLARLGLERTPEAYPSLLLGALDLSPLEVASLYNALASGGFVQPLRAVRSVVDSDGRPLQRYRLELDGGASPASVFAINTAMVQVMRRGTGRTVQQRLPPWLTTAGKTGTSDGLRDSWFAGFSGDHLVVTWMGNDANEPIGLTGATGAGRVWADIMGGIDNQPFAGQPGGDAERAWVDYYTGLATEPGCADAIELGLPRAAVPPRAAACGSSRLKFGERMRQFIGGDR